MGMSASQARLLGLTARQSNLEYEGQQINQQRTNLSNQSANYYNSLLTMTVPTPPSTDDYTTVQYSFVIGGNDATVSQILPQTDTDGNTTYLISYSTNLSTIGIQDNSAYKVTVQNKPQTGNLEKEDSENYDKNKTYYVKSFRTDDTSNQTLVSDPNDERIDGNCIFYDANGNAVDKSKALQNGKLRDGFYALVDDKTDKEQGYSELYLKLADQASYSEAFRESAADDKVAEEVYTFEQDSQGSDYIDTLSVTSGAEFTEVSPEYAEAFENSNPKLDPNNFYQYEASTGIRFVAKEDAQASAGTAQKSVKTYAVASLTEKQNKTLKAVDAQFDTNGRVSSVTDKDGNTYTMTTSTVTDDDAYDDAYNKYTYEQYVYDQKQNAINANIEILQAQDKNLELRLSQLNTEHSAIQTEIEAVNKVLSKNIESSFKTFNA